jgi:hypothetical protein
VLDQFQFAHALNNILKMDMNAYNALIDSLLQVTISNAYQLNAQTQIQFLVMLITAIDVPHAHKDIDQMHKEEDVIELSQHVAAHKNMIQVDIIAFNAQHIKLQQIIIVNVFQPPAQKQDKFSVIHKIAINAEIVRMDLNQITYEDNV